MQACEIRQIRHVAFNGEDASEVAAITAASCAQGTMTAEYYSDVESDTPSSIVPWQAAVSGLVYKL